MARVLLWILVVLVVLCNLGFDLATARVGFRIAGKVEAADRWGNPTHAPDDTPLRTRFDRLNDRIPLGTLGRWVFAFRYTLTALPLLVLLIMALRRRVLDWHLGAAVAMGAFILAGKAALWQALWYVVDVNTRF